jgi:hypothetical protein
MAELRDELAAVQRETVAAAQIQRAIALFDPVWDLLLVPGASASCTCLSSRSFMTVPRATSSWLSTPWASPTWLPRPP